MEQNKGISDIQDFKVLSSRAPCPGSYRRTCSTKERNKSKPEEDLGFSAGELRVRLAAQQASRTRGKEEDKDPRKNISEKQ